MSEHKRATAIVRAPAPMSIGAPAVGLAKNTSSQDDGRQLLGLPDRARAMGIAIMAAKGSGKGHLAKLIAWQDFRREIPLVIIDPVGGTIDPFLDKITRLPREEQQEAWRRVIYIDAAGRSGHVMPCPLYYRLGNESLYEISQRYLDVIRKLDPHLQEAPKTGLNALLKTGAMTGMGLSSLSYQITEAADLLYNPERWMSRLHQAAATYPEVGEVVAFFHQFAQLREADRADLRDSFLTKVSLLTLDPVMRAIFGAEKPGIDWEQVIRKRQAVLLDIRHVHDIERRRLLMWWYFGHFYEYIKHRGHGRHQPVSVIIDELTQLLNFQAHGSDAFVETLDELINVRGRSHQVWLTIILQEAWQVDNRIAKALQTMGTLIVGTTSDADTARALGRQLFPFEPYWVKRYEPVFNSFMGIPRVIYRRPIDFTVEEQEHLHATEIKQRGLFRFFIRPAPREGDVGRRVYAMTIAWLDRGLWVNEELVGKARAILSTRSGVPVATVLAAIQGRQDHRPLYEPRSYQGQPTDTQARYARNGKDRRVRKERTFSLRERSIEDDDDIILREKA